MNKCTKCGKEFEGQFCPECGTAAEEKAICANCGAELTPGAEFCPSCGSKIPVKGSETTTFCVNCGKEIPAGTTFCPNCGMRVGSVPPPAAPVASAMPRYNTYPGEKNTIALIGFIMIFFGATSGIGFILCIVGLAKAKNYRPDDSYKSLALAGVIIGSISIALGLIVGVLIGILAVSEFASVMPLTLI